MSYSQIQAVVLAAGKSSRFTSAGTKLAMPLCGQPLLLYPLQALAYLKVPLCLVVGHQKEEVMALVAQHHFPAITFVEQPEARGTGDAVRVTAPHWEREHILIINGDMPLIDHTLIHTLITTHQKTGAAVSFVTTQTNDPLVHGYGRVITRNGSIKIVEERHLQGDKQEYPCLNAGLYLFSRSFLTQAIEQLTMNENSHEFYITDLIHEASSRRMPIEMVPAPFDMVRGVNTLEEFAIAEKIKCTALVRSWMGQGVYFPHAESVHLDAQVVIGSGSIISAHTQLRGTSILGSSCTIDPFCIIENATLEQQVTVKAHTIIRNAHISEQATIGPFAHVQEKSIIKERVTVGNFVEVSRSEIGAGSKAKHLSYIGNALLGERVNVGAGTITCNYNGVTKEQTIIGNNVLIGSNNSLVAPITLGDNAITAAGSTLTSDVPAEALAIGRAYQVTKEHYAPLLKERLSHRAAQKKMPTPESAPA